MFQMNNSFFRLFVSFLRPRLGKQGGRWRGGSGVWIAFLEKQFGNSDEES